MDVIVVENVYKSFNTEQVLGGISIRVRKGESVGIVGPNGCGKTTLLRIIYGIIKADSGSVKVFGRLGYVPQSDLLLPWKTLRENIALPLITKRVRREVIDKKIIEVAEILGLVEHLDKYPKNVSGGTARKANIARALVTDPDILLLDEPFTGLDRESYRSLVKILKNLRKIGVSMLIVSHMLSELKENVDRIYVLSHKPAKVISEEILTNKRS